MILLNGLKAWIENNKDNKQIHGLAPRGINTVQA
jgi:hypothetical protein